ncbi:MAG: TonB-dependent receptor [Candidatus Wenzhouxiangella sp. M2_3B_020]
MKLQKSILSIVIGCSLLTVASAQDANDENEDSQELDVITVTAEASQVELAPAYAGDQVARGGRAGLLGNLDYMDSPFTGIAFTEALIEDQQSDSVGDVLQNEPVVRVAKGFGNFQEVYVIRGFPVFSDDLTLNGLYGILPRQFVAAELLERVEVFRGANAFINGAAPGGSGVGGTINLVPKRAPADGVRQLTLGWEAKGLGYAAADLGARFGAAEDWGVRVNAVRREGESAIEDQDRSLHVLSIGTDYSGERFRFSADLGYQDNRTDAPRPQVTPLGEIPDPPSADANYAQPWTFTDEEQLFGVVRGEYDLTDAVTAWLAFGGRQGEEANVLANPQSTVDGQLTAYRFDNTREDDVFSADVGVRAEFATGPIRHRLVTSASRVDLESKNAFALSNFFSPFESNLYAPVEVAPPATDFFTGGQLSDPLTTEKVETGSAAVADTLFLLDERLIATLGLRHQDIETRSFDFNTGQQISGYSDDEITPVAGLVYVFTDRVSFYGNYAESLQPGDIAPASVGGEPIENAGEALAPFVGEQIEVGVKYDGGNLGGTLSLFALERPNAIVADRVFQASGEQRNEGVEVTAFGEPVDGLRIIGGVTWLDAELARTQGGINEGNTVIGVPDVQANVNVDWDVGAPEGLALEGRLVWTGEQFVNESNTIALDDWHRFDIGVRYETRLGSVPLRLRARLENVTDESYWASTGGFPGANYLIQGNARSFQLSGTFDF